MDSIILMVFTFVLVLFVVISVLAFFLFLFFRFLENFFIEVFGRPLFVHFYPFPKKIKPEYLYFLNTKFTFYIDLPDKEKVYFEHRIACFLEKYEFIGREDFVITEEIKVFVAATFVMLSFGMRKYLCEVFDKVIIYPSIYFSRLTKKYHKGEFNPSSKVVVFSWEDFQKGFDISSDNLNLGIHEFAHVLYYQGLQSNSGSSLFSKMYTLINKEVRDTVFREQLIQSNYFRLYAFTNQFEFLAVILECFFETPLEFKMRFPDLYGKVSLMLNMKH